MKTVDVSELVITLISATGKFCSSRINNEKEQEQYDKAIKDALTCCDPGMFGDDPVKLLSTLRELRIRAGKKVQKRLFKEDPKKYYVIGMDHSIEALESILKRFHMDYGLKDNALFKILEEK